jgi:CyaY protein
MLSESEFSTLAKTMFARVEQACSDLDPDVADFDRNSNDVLAITFGNGKKCVINTQRPTRQIWVAFSARAWHFRYDDTGTKWVDEKDDAVEFVATVKQIVKEGAGLDIAV